MSGILLWLRSQRGAIRAVTAVAGGTTFAGIATFAQEVLLARKFGTSHGIDAYLLAAGVIAFVSGILAQSVGPAVVPAFIVVREREGPASAQALLGTCSLLSFGWLMFVGAGLALASPQIAATCFPSLDAANQQLLTRCVLILSAVVVITGFSQMWASLLNAGGRYALPAAIGALRPTAVVVVLLSLHGPAVTPVAIGLCSGYLLEGVCLAWFASRTGVNVLPRPGRLTAAVRTALGQYLPIVATSVLTCTMGITDQLVASRLASGSVATLTFAQRLPGPFGVLSSAAIGAVLFPVLARAHGRRDVESLRRIVRRVLVIVLGVGATVTVTFFALALPLVRLVYERGAFTEQDAVNVSRVLRIYALQLPLVVACNVLTRFFLATQTSHRIWRGFVVYPIINGVLDVVFARVFGVDGIAWSTLAVTLYSFCYVYWCARKVFQHLDSAADDRHPVEQRR